MTTDLEDTITRLADIANNEKSTTGITQAYASAPATLDVVPAMCFFVGPQTYDPYKSAEDVKLEKTTVYIRLYEEVITLGIPGEVEARLKARIPLVRDMLLAHPGLSFGGTYGPLEGIERMVLESSTGVRPLAFGDKSFAGVEWKVTIGRYVEVTYAANE